MTQSDQPKKMEYIKKGFGTIIRDTVKSKSIELRQRYELLNSQYKVIKKQRYKKAHDLITLDDAFRDGNPKKEIKHPEKCDS